MGRSESRSKKQKCQFFRKIKAFLVFFCSHRRSKTNPQSHEKKPTSRDIKDSHGSFWVRDRLLGKGSFGSVFLAKTIAPDFPFEIAVKSSFMAVSHSLQLEKNVLQDLASCINIVHCYGDDITETESGEKVYNLLLEYCPGCNLFEYLRLKPFGLPEIEVRRYTRDIVNGIVSTHYSGYIHCDIKPENVLLSPDTRDKESGYWMAKISDFGLSRKMSDNATVREVIGTFEYMSPELVKDKQLDWRADIWAVGCVVVEMLTGQDVWRFEREENYDVYNLIAFTEEIPKIQYDSSEMAKDFLSKCLVRDPEKRSSACALMDHPFLQI